MNIEEKASAERRLLAHRSITEDGCWVWTKRKSTGGYGQILVKREAKARASGRKRLWYPATAHRVAAVVWLGFDLDSPVWVLHRCDNPPCFNPEHLFYGDAVLNMADRDAKGRMARGERNGNVRLSDAQVREVRRIGAAESQRSLARRLGVSKSLIGAILREEVRAA